MRKNFSKNVAASGKNEDDRHNTHRSKHLKLSDDSLNLLFTHDKNLLRGFSKYQRANCAKIDNLDTRRENEELLKNREGLNQDKLEEC